MDFQKKRIQLVVFVAAIIVLSLAAEKCRQLVGEEGSSQSGKFTVLNCLDMGSGTLSCAVKEGVKLYFYNIRSSHVERARQHATESALVDALSQGMSPTDSAKHAQKESKKTAKLASRQAKRIIGPIISSGWDFFEAVYFGGTLTEGFLRGTGTLFGAYGGGFLGEERLGRFGYLVGSHMGSWVGGRIGLMIYDVINGVQFWLQFVETVGSEVKETILENSEPPKSSSYDETSVFDSSEGSSVYKSSPSEKETPVFDSSEGSSVYESSPSKKETPAFDSSEGPNVYESTPSEESNVYDSTGYQSSDTYEHSEL